MDIGRNQLCPCGSGNKYKRCCGAFGTKPTSGTRPYPRPIPSEVLKEIARWEGERMAREAKHGEVKEIITAEMGEWRFVASGKEACLFENVEGLPRFPEQPSPRAPRT